MNSPMCVISCWTSTARASIQGSARIFLGEAGIALGSALVDRSTSSISSAVVAQPGYNPSVGIRTENSDLGLVCVGRTAAPSSSYGRPRSPNPTPGPSEIESRPLYEVADFDALMPEIAEAEDRIRKKLSDI